MAPVRPMEISEVNAIVGPSSSSGTAGFAQIPLRRACDEHDLLSLKVEFRVGKDDSGDFMRAESSTFGLWVATGQKSKARPVFRVEYDRNATSKPQAHVHIHAESVELGWIYGSAGLALPNMHEIHFPVGGKRFRPTVEDLLLFLHRENLFTEWHSVGVLYSTSIW